MKKQFLKEPYTAPLCEPHQLQTEGFIAASPLFDDPFNGNQDNW